MSDNYLLNMYEKALKLPAGRKLFSMVFSRYYYPDHQRTSPQFL